MSEPSRVLIVENDEPIRQLLADLLLLEGFDVRIASEGTEALAVLEAWRPDVILLDLMMPGMDGWSFRQAQRERTLVADVPVVVVSASRHLDERSAALGAAATVAKPFEVADVLDVIRRVTGSANAPTV